MVERRFWTVQTLYCCVLFGLPLPISYSFCAVSINCYFINSSKMSELQYQNVDHRCGQQLWPRHSHCHFWHLRKSKFEQLFINTILHFLWHRRCRESPASLRNENGTAPIKHHKKEKPTPFNLLEETTARMTSQITIQMCMTSSTFINHKTRLTHDSFRKTLGFRTSAIVTESSSPRYGTSSSIIQYFYALVVVDGAFLCAVDVP
jgi:hypothetical protein